MNKVIGIISVIGISLFVGIVTAQDSSIWKSPESNTPSEPSSPRPTPPTKPTSTQTPAPTPLPTENEFPCNQSGPSKNQEESRIVAGDQVPRSKCQKIIDEQIGTFSRMYFDSCLASRECKRGRLDRFSLRCALTRSNCIAESNADTSHPLPQTCSVQYACKDVLNASNIETELAKLSYIMRSICIQYVQIIRNEKGRDGTACTLDELNKDMQNRFPTCNRRDKGNG